MRLGWAPLDVETPRGLVESLDPDFDEELFLDTARVGFTYRIKPRQRLIGSFIYQDFDHKVRDPRTPPEDLDFILDQEFTGYQFELQHLAQAKKLKTIVGFRYINELDKIG